MPKQRSTHRKASHLHESTRGMTLRTRSPAARIGDVSRSTWQERSDHRTPLTRNDIPVLIQEVVQSLSIRGPHSHDDPPVENTSHQLTQTNATVQGTPLPPLLSNPVTNNTLTTEDIPSLVQQVLQALQALYRVSHCYSIRPPRQTGSRRSQLMMWTET